MMTFNKAITLLAIFSILTSCVREKETEYWLNPENQNGDLSLFYATKEYCSEAERAVKELKVLKKLTDSLSVINKKSVTNDSSFNSTEKLSHLKELDDLHRRTYRSIENLKQEMVAANGGYCDNGNFDLPVLPYRRKDVYEFWSDFRNANRLLKIASGFNADIYNILLKYGKEGDSVRLMIEKHENWVKSLKKMNAIEAMIFLKEIQFEIVNRKLKVKALLEESRLKRVANEKAST